jgi:hypothetical protein
MPNRFTTNPFQYWYRLSIALLHQQTAETMAYYTRKSFARAENLAMRYLVARQQIPWQQSQRLSWGVK